MVYKPDHHRALEGSGWEGYVYEHQLIAEEFLGRALKNDEVVHHLDGNRGNNNPTNLLVLTQSQHAKLHAWLRTIQYEVIEKPTHSETQRCKRCGHPLKVADQKFYCSPKCAHLDKRTIERPSKEELSEDLQKMSWVAIGKKHGVSDNAIRKWAKQYGLL